METEIQIKYEDNPVDRLGLNNTKKESGSPERVMDAIHTVQLGAATTAGSPLKDGPPPAPHPNLGPTQDGSFKGNYTCDKLYELAIKSLQPPQIPQCGNHTFIIIIYSKL